MLSEELLEDLATVHLHPQTQAGGDLDFTPLLRAVEAAAVAAERERWIGGARVQIPTETMEQEIQAHVRRAVAAERERCVDVRVAAQYVLDRFRETQETGASTRDRVFAIDVLAKALEA